MKAASLTASPGLPSVAFSLSENVSFSVCGSQSAFHGATTRDFGTFSTVG